MTDQGADDLAREQLVEQAMAVPDVARALEVFQAASQRAPLVFPPTPAVRFSTTTNV